MPHLRGKDQAPPASYTSLGIVAPAPGNAVPGVLVNYLQLGREIRSDATPHRHLGAHP